jgi:hypothetical protein
VLKEFFKQFPTGAKVKNNSDLAQSLTEANVYRFNREAKFLDAIPTDQSRYSFWLGFGITPDEQIALEEGFRPLNMGRILEDIQEVPTLLQWSGA